ncbi:MAG: aldo/keto reductase [Clostridiales bacterium]|nr:aldo/keto reductase [Clostridiales bacterium]
MNNYFNEIKKNFGFGCMRLPMSGDAIDIEQTKQMVHEFIANGFNYFDTAHGYLSERSEPTLKTCLTGRYPRESYVLTDKLTDFFFKKQEDIRPLFEKQLEICGVEYFDFYLMHAQSRRNFDFFKQCRAYETAFELKAEGKIRHVGLSFHDTADFLDRILTEYPQIEVVQLQLNYLDFDDPAVQSRLCYEVCVKHGKPVIVMEPIKGGHLINLPEKALPLVESLGVSPANLALRFAASCDNVFMVLSGMSSIEQMRENVSFMKDFHPLSERERAVAHQVAAVFKGENIIPCTACRYCVDGCPKKISIPDLFACLNTKRHFNDWNADYYYNNVHTKNKGKASDCVKCGKCEKACPQKLNIRDLLEDVVGEFERKSK